MPPAAHDLLPDEEAARRLLLARALDEADGEGRLVGPTEKQQAEDEALRETAGGAGTAPEPLPWLQARADRIAALLEHRSPALALSHRPAWESHAAWLLPLAALLAGALIDRIDNPRQVNLLSPPLLAFLLWNIGVYLLLAAHALRPRREHPRIDLRWPWRRAGVHAAVAAAFQRHWWAIGGTLQSQRWRRILHSSAAAWGLGVALSIVLGGLVREYRVGWESTLLDQEQVHAVLRWMFAPVGALLGIEPFSMAEVARLHFGSGEAVARPEARRWVALYIGLVALVVIVPRAVLAAWAAWRERLASRSLRIDLEEPYYAGLLARVTPARVRVALEAATQEARERICLVLHQMGGVPGGAGPWTVITTARGDTLQLVGPQAAAAPPPQPSTQSWWPRGQAAPPPQGPPVDIRLLAGDAITVEPALGSSRSTLAWDDLPTWREDGRLWQAMLQAGPAHQRAGLERLWRHAYDHALQRLRASVQMLADELVQDVLDTETVAAGAVGMRQLLVREERGAAERAGQEATAQLLARVRERQARTDERLLALHGLSPEALQREAIAAGVRLQRAVDAPQAGIAGAASGAAVGAGIDLVTGGLTLGAASALGALVGGGAAMVAAAWRNAKGEAGAAAVSLDDSALPVLVRGALLRYLSVVHAGRAGMAAAQARAAAVQALDVDALVRSLRERRMPQAAGDTQAIEAALQARIEALLQGLHGASPTPA